MLVITVSYRLAMLRPVSSRLTLPKVKDFAPGAMAPGAFFAYTDNFSGVMANVIDGLQSLDIET